MQHPEMKNTVFGEVLAELLEVREIPVTPATVGKFAEDAGLDGWAVIHRMADADAEHVSYLDRLADALNLSRSERLCLAYAYTYEREAPMTTDRPPEGGKTVAELREEHGITREELAAGMSVSVRDLEMLEASGQRYHSLDPEWFVPVADLYGYEKVFWYPPAKAVKEWSRAITILDGFVVLAGSLDSEPLIAVLGDALAGAREELDGCRDLLKNFERQGGRVRAEAARD